MNNKSNKDDGLPEVAQNAQQKKPILVVIMGVIVLSICSLYFYKKPDKQIEKPFVETYTMTAEPMENKKEPVFAQKVTANETTTQLVNPEIVQQQIAFIQEKQKELQQRLTAPLMVVNANQPTNTIMPTQQAISKDANTQFMQEVSAQSETTSTATMIGPLNTVIAEGNLIHAILESATNSDLPGSLRAVVSEPVYAEDGSQILIPIGSRLIGQYKSGILQGQSRIFVVWKRLITPSGLSVQLGSSGVDNLGVSGMGADEIDRHFWERFGTASLLSLIGAGAANVGVSGNTQDNSEANYRAAVASSFAQSADQSLQQESMIAPTLKQYQGKPIMVFVAHDLHFQNAMKSIKPKINSY